MKVFIRDETDSCDFIKIGKNEYLYKLSRELDKLFYCAFKVEIEKKMSIGQVCFAIHTQYAAKELYFMWHYYEMNVVNKDTYFLNYNFINEELECLQYLKVKRPQQLQAGIELYHKIK